MAQKTDWLPSGRQNQLNMAQNWLTIFYEPSSNPNSHNIKSTDWGIPTATVEEFAAFIAAAEKALTTAKSEETRTPVATAACKTAFDALLAAMRNLKKRFFYVPPLTEADLVALGLKIPDRTPTASGVPTAEVTIETYLVGRHQLGIRCIYLTGNASDPANKEFRVWYSVIGQGETAPVNPKELRTSFSTKRKKDILDFDFGDSGKTAWFAVQLENEGKKGPWGPLVQALIP